MNATNEQCDKQQMTISFLAYVLHNAHSDNEPAVANMISM